MQKLFELSEETNESGHKGKPLPGLGVIPGKVVKFDETKRSVPHIGWNGTIRHQSSPALRYVKEEGDEVYFVHSYYALLTDKNKEWVLTRTTYEGQEFISSIQRGNVVAAQFHPEKSGTTGLNFIKGFLESVEDGTLSQPTVIPVDPSQHTHLVKRVLVALDVCSNDNGELVMTKGDQYDVRENEGHDTTSGRGGVRNLGKSVSLAKRYNQEGADEIAFLNITSFRQGVIADMPMLQVLEESSKCIFVPLAVEGGIRSYKDESSGTTYSALEVASRYFRAGRIRCVSLFRHVFLTILSRVLFCREFSLLHLSNSSKNYIPNRDSNCSACTNSILTNPYYHSTDQHRSRCSPCRQRLIRLKRHQNRPNLHRNHLPSLRSPSSRRIHWGTIPWKSIRRTS